MSHKRPLRVALVADEDPGWGGIGTYTGILARALRELGHRVHLVLRGWEEDSRQEHDGLVVHRVVVPEPAWRRGTVTAISRLYTARESFVFSARVSRRVIGLAREEGVSVVEAPEFHAANLLSALRTRVLRRPPAVVTRLHTPSYLTAQMDGERRTGDVRVQELLEHVSVRAATMITSPSAALAAQVSGRWRLAPDRISVVPNPIDAELFAPTEDGPRAARILVAGRVEPGKGQDVMIEALPAIRCVVPEAQLHLVGEDADGGRATAALRARASTLGLDDRAVTVAGAVEREEMPSIYRSASVCVVPSRFDAFPYTCVEAMACGRPVVASHAGGPAEIITDGHDGRLVPPGDPAALAEAVAELLVDAPARERMGVAARETVLRRCSAPAVAGQMAELYATASGSVR